MEVKLNCNLVLFKDLENGQTFMTNYLGEIKHYMKANSYQLDFLYEDKKGYQIFNCINLETGNFHHFRDCEEVITTFGAFKYNVQTEVC